MMVVQNTMRTGGVNKVKLIYFMNLFTFRSGIIQLATGERAATKQERITRNYRSHEFCRDDGFNLARLSTTTVLSGLLILLLE